MAFFLIVEAKKGSQYSGVPCIGTFHTGLMNTPAHVSGLSGLSGQPAAPPVELDQSRGPGMWKLQQSMMVQTALGTKRRLPPVTLTHAVRTFVLKLYKRILQLMLCFKSCKN